MILDHPVHQRLGECRLVAFVMAEAAIADHVQHHILVEQLAEFGGDAGCMHHGFRIVAIHMEDRRLHHQRHIGAIGRGARIDRRGGEADLVVDDEMNGAAGAEALGPGRGEAFRNDALARESGIAMDQQRQHAGAALVVAQLMLLGAGLAQHHGIDDFQMRRVRRERQMHLMAVKLAIRRCTQMILHVARAFDFGRIGGAALEFMEQLAIGLAHDIDEHVQAAAMGHAQHDFLYAQLAAALDDLLQRRDGGFAAVQAETFGADKTVGGEFLEAFGFDQFVQDRLLAFGRELDVLVLPFDAALQPVFLLGIVDMHEFIADAAAIGPLEQIHHLARRGGVHAHDAGDIDGLVHLRFMEAIEGRVQLRMRRVRRDPQRIEVGFKMTDDAEGAHQLNGADGIERGGAHAFAVCWGGCGRRAFFRRRLGSRRLAGQRQGDVVLGQDRFVIALPGRAAAQLGGGQARFAQFGEIGTPAFIQGVGIGEILGVEPFQEGGIGAGQKAGRVQNVVGGAIEPI